MTKIEFWFSVFVSVTTLRLSKTQLFCLQQGFVTVAIELNDGTQLTIDGNLL